MTKVLGLNGSPRQDWNCATLLDHALRGAADKGAATERIDLQRLKYRGCISCFQCKRIGGPSFGRCVLRDDLTPVLDEILDTADGLIVAAPVFFSDLPGMTRMFLERLWFPGLTYSKDGSIAYTRRRPVAFLYAMNASHASMYDALWQNIEHPTEYILGPVSSLKATDTLQFDDYSKYASSMFDPEHKRRRHDTQFPLDCKAAYELGASLIP